MQRRSRKRSTPGLYGDTLGVLGRHFSVSWIRKSAKVARYVHSETGNNTHR